MKFQNLLLLLSFSEEASLQITKIVEEFTNEKGEKKITETVVQGSPLFSICSYIAETEDALNLVEGERVYVIESNNSDWWFVRKHLTEEKGWVPAVYLRDEPSYTLYVQKKLHEKIDKLPIFEKPGPGSEVFAPKFVEKLQPIHAPDGVTVQFECKVEGNPRPQITWFRQTAIIKPSPDFQIFYDDDNVATLIINEVFPEDAGTFTCVAKNAAGFASSTTELIIESPLSDHGSDTTGLSRRSLSRESSLADILEGIPPTFSRKPKAKVVPLGSDVDLEVRLVAIPEPDITWLFNGRPVKQTSNLKINVQSDMHMYVSTLKITKVTRGQEGVYTVLAKNREGEATVDIVLKIKTGEPEKPVVVDQLKDVTVGEGEGIALTSQVTGVPTPKVVWLKDGKPVKLEMTTSGDVYTAVIRNAKPTDAGKYTLEASNPHGKATTNAQVIVQGHIDYGHIAPPCEAVMQDNALDDTNIMSPDGSVESDACTVVDFAVDRQYCYEESGITMTKEETKHIEKMVKQVMTMERKEVQESKEITVEYIQGQETKVNEVVGVVSKITKKIDKLELAIDDLVKKISGHDSLQSITDIESESEDHSHSKHAYSEVHKTDKMTLKDDFLEKVKKIGSDLKSRLQPSRYIIPVKQQCKTYEENQQNQQVTLFVSGHKKRAVANVEVSATVRVKPRKGTEE